MSFLLGFSSSPVRGQGQVSVTGTVVDASDGSALVGATVLLRAQNGTSLVERTTTESDGTFQLAYFSPGQYVLEVRYVGYDGYQQPLVLEAGTSRDLTIEMEPETASLETVVESASRRPEVVREAPASVSVLGSEALRRGITTSSIEALRSTPGVDIAQTGIDRREVVLRGFNDAFTGGPHVLLDHREAALPSLGANVYSLMPTPSLDLDRIEVVRGPGSALYGAGAGSGIVHFFTKDPFRHPSTALSVVGGTRSYFQGQFRKAGVLGDRLGYKFTGEVARGHEWTLNPNHLGDATELSRYRVYESREAVPAGRRVSGIDRDGDGSAEAFRLRREDLYRKYNANGLLKYRLDGGASLSLRGGYAEIVSTLQSDIGTIQANGFGYSYGRLRFESESLSAQVSLNRNHARGDMYIYGSGQSITDRSLQWTGQLKYFFDLEGLNTRGIVGGDADLTRPRTEGTLLGRNENDDALNEVGAYAQTTTDLTANLDLTLAARIDHNNVTETPQLSPRVSLTYLLGTQHSFRATYNRGLSSLGSNAYFLDLESQRRRLPGDRSLVYQSRGVAEGFTFEEFRQSNTARYFLPTPNFPGTFFGASLPLGQFPVPPTYSAAARQFRQRLQGPNSTFLGPLADLPDPALQAYHQLLQTLAQSSGGNSFTAETVLGIPEEADEFGYRQVEGPLNVPPLQHTTTQTLELGYKGTFADKIQLGIDGYYARKKDFIGPLRVESPFVYLSPEFVRGDVRSRVQSDAPTQAVFQDFLNAAGISEQEAFDLLTKTLGGTASAVVQPDQAVLPGGGTPNDVGALLTYRNFGTVEYLGLDASVRVEPTDAFDAFGNVSILSDNFFSNEELDAVGEELSVALNAPSLKVNGGFDYDLSGGISVGLTGRYIEGFPVRSGPYVGRIDSYTVFDVRAGYDVPAVPGLRLDLTVRNVLDNEHREFVGAPSLGRMALAQLTYELP